MRAQSPWRQQNASWSHGDGKGKLKDEAGCARTTKQHGGQRDPARKPQNPGGQGVGSRAAEAEPLQGLQHLKRALLSPGPSPRGSPRRARATQLQPPGDKRSGGDGRTPQSSASPAHPGQRHLHSEGGREPGDRSSPGQSALPAGRRRRPSAWMAAGSLGRAWGEPGRGRGEPGRGRAPRAGGRGWRTRIGRGGAASAGGTGSRPPRGSAAGPEASALGNPRTPSP